MGVTEDLADALAQDALRLAEETGDDTLINDISNVLGASSTTAQEAFLTSVRVRRANNRARELLAERAAKPAQPE